MINKKHSKGFTIVELLVVIIVIGILAGITLIVYSDITKKATVAVFQSDLKNAAQQLNMYRVVNGSYPAGIDCSATPAENTICLKPSGANVYGTLKANNIEPKTFCVNIINGIYKYHITDNGAPVDGACTNSCLDILNNGDSTGDGLYSINNSSGKNFQVYCDMTTKGGGWSLVGSWDVAQEWTKSSLSTDNLLDVTAKNAISSNFGGTSINDFRVLASDNVTQTEGNSYADWYYHYDTQILWKEVWAPTFNSGGHIEDAYRSTTPRQALKPFNYSYNIKFNYQVSQNWNNLSDWSYTGPAVAGCLANYWGALTTPNKAFGVYNTNYYNGSNGANCSSPVLDGTLGICPSNLPNCITGQDVSTANSIIGYDDSASYARFGATDTTNVGGTAGVDAVTKLWWFIR